METQQIRTTYLEHLKGLMFEKLLPKFSHLFLFEKETHGMVHTWFMKGPIDIVFFYKNRVIEVHKNVKPWKCVIPKNKYTSFLETQVGYIDENNFQEGDEVVITGYLKTKNKFEILKV